MFYVALTRARDFLEVCYPMLSYGRGGFAGDRQTLPQLTRFLPQSVWQHFEREKVAARSRLDERVIVAGRNIVPKINAMFNYSN